jgi:potassium large conductance calcium-activated channel subfamily M alpha protein 1
MQGNPIKSKDLQKAGIKKARAVIILSKSTTDIEQADMVDADTIFIYKAIKNETKTALIIAELVSVSAISFINSTNDDSNVRKQGYWLSQPFAVGEIYISSMLDTLICQAFYNPYITDILQQLIMGSAGSTFAHGLKKKMQEKKISQSTLYLLNINDELLRLGNRDFPKKVMYKELFEFFAKNNMVAIGINRNSARLSTLKNNKNDKRYVYLCPKYDAMVDIDHDKIYILASEDYFSTHKLNDPYKNKNNTYYQFNKTSKLIDKSNELVLDLAQGMKKLVEENSRSFSEAYSIKKVLNGLRSSMRIELAEMHDRLVEGKNEIIEVVNSEDSNNNDSSDKSNDSFKKKKDKIK